MADKQTILVVEDDPNLAEMLNAYFHIQGYRVLTSEGGEEAVRTCQAQSPHIALLDVRLPDIDGYEVARRLRSNRRTQRIPLIFLTERGDRADRLRGLELGAVDYLTKPFDLKELLLRVRNILQRIGSTSPVNTLTGLPEGRVVEEWLNGLLTRADSAVVHVGVAGLAQFREAYGFMDADNVLRVVSVLLAEVLREAGEDDDLLGHLDAEDFLIITHPARVQRLGEMIQERLNGFADNFYPLQNRLSPAPAAAFGPTLQLTVGWLSAPGRAFDNVAALVAAVHQAPTH